jgi:hypothetical protein
MLDSSTFINALIVDRVALVVLLRPDLCFPEYVFRFELGVNARESTRAAVGSWVKRKQIGVANLTLADLDRIASLAAPRRIGLGEIACAVIAERREGGVLCDDWRAHAWLKDRTQPKEWHSIDDLLLEAAANGHIGEHDLVEFQITLKQHKYDCRCDLRLAHLQRQMARFIPSQ